MTEILMAAARNAEACLRRLMYYFETSTTLVVADQKFSRDASHVSQQTLASRFPTLTISHSNGSVSISGGDNAAYCDFMTFILKCNPITNELFENNRKKKPSHITPRRYDKDGMHSHGPNMMKFESPPFLSKESNHPRSQRTLASEVTSLPHPKVDSPMTKQNNPIVITKKGDFNRLVIKKNPDQEQPQGVTVRLMDPSAVRKFQPPEAPPLGVLSDPPPLTGLDPILVDSEPQSHAKVTFSLSRNSEPKRLEPTFNPEPLFDTMWKTVEAPKHVLRYERKRSDVPVMTKMDFASAAIKSTESQMKALYPYLKVCDSSRSENSQLNVTHSQGPVSAQSGDPTDEVKSLPSVRKGYVK